MTSLIDRDYHYLIFGAGKTGASIAQFLASEGCKFNLYDEKTDAWSNDLPQPQERRCGELSANWLASHDVVVVSPGVPLAHPALRAAVAAGVPVVGDIEIFAREFSEKIVAVTGANGKSTVVSMLGDILLKAGVKAAVGGNIGVPALDLLPRDLDVVVLELSSYQLEATDSLHSAVAAVLNISEDHMDRYADLQHYAKTKGKIYQSCKVAVYPVEDVLAHPSIEDAGKSVAICTDANPVDTSMMHLASTGDECFALMSGAQCLINSDELPFEGTHNYVNALFAWAMAREVGVADEKIGAALKAFSGLPHRAEFVAEIAGVRYINDSKATNVGASVAAISGMPGKVVLIAGGEGKDANFDPLADAIVQHCREVVLIGRDASKIAEVLPASVPVSFSDSLEQAIEVAHKVAQPGDSVLLSPACASFDMFTDYEERGRIFCQKVRGLCG